MYVGGVVLASEQSMPVTLLASPRVGWAGLGTTPKLPS